MVWLYNPKNLKIFRIWLESDTEAVLESGDTEINQSLVIGKLMQWSLGNVNQIQTITLKPLFVLLRLSSISTKYGPITDTSKHITPGTWVMYPFKVSILTLTDWTAFPLDVQPLLWGTVQIRTAGLKVHPVTFDITILKRWKNKVSMNLLHE